MHLPPKLEHHYCITSNGVWHRKVYFIQRFVSVFIDSRSLNCPPICHFCSSDLINLSNPSHSCNFFLFFSPPPTSWTSFPDGPVSALCAGGSRERTSEWNSKAALAGFSQELPALPMTARSSSRVHSSPFSLAPFPLVLLWDLPFESN